jgi:three-Cys-motif partner protein
MSNLNFFEEQTASSRIKASIVSDYFPSYCKIITKKFLPKEIRYVDLFAGPGIYRDGNLSTPMLIGKQCQQDPFLKKNVRLIFNDNEYGDVLKRNFQIEFPENTFDHLPYFGNKTVGLNDSVKDFLLKDTHRDGKNECPSLLFIDPFGYKGIETRVLAQFLKNWGNEVFLFVNIKRIHPALENEKFDELMKDLFPTTLDKVRKDRRYKLNTAERIKLIIECLGEEYKTLLKTEVFYTAFKFQEEDNEATSHYILHITKGSRGFDLVKQIYNDFANVGTIFDGINTYTFDAKKLENEPIELFDQKILNIERLKELILSKYAGRTLRALELFDEHHKGYLYSRSHYTIALRQLADDKFIETSYTDNKAHRYPVLISNDCTLMFR